MAARPARDSLTNEQRTAVVGRDASIVLSSGAGCGKTFVLTERYLGHLREDGADVGQIVAITFTDRAARQMRERIRRAILQELRTCADADAARWARHLDDLETAPISTIHAFCSALLRQHAVAIGLDPRFEVLEDFLAANLEREAVTASLQELLTASTPAGDDLRALIPLYGWGVTRTAVHALVPAWDEPRWQDFLQEPPEDIAARWRNRDRAALLPAYVSWLVTTDPRIAQCLSLLRETPCLGTATQARVAKILDETPRLAQASDLAAALEDLKETAKVGNERGDAWPSEEIYRTVQAAFTGYRDVLYKGLDLCGQDEDLTEPARTAQRFLRVAAAAVQAYRQRKRRNAAVDFQDLLVLARDLVRDRPEVRERLQNRFRFLLVDELQDTDPVQMELLDLLSGAGLTTGKLFAVGDYKQSIYRFRGAKAELFHELRQRVPHEGRLLLKTNFRSQPAILHFVNALFGGGPVALPNYEKLLPSLKQVNPEPCVEFLWSPLIDKTPAPEARRIEADRIARRIAAMIGGKEMLVLDRSAKGPPTKLRPVRAGDIVLLFRAMSSVAIYEEALRRNGLDYYLVGGRAFFAQQEIYDLVNLLHALENPQDAVSLAGALRSPFCCLSDEALFILARHPDGLWAGLADEATRERLPADQHAPADRAWRWLNRWRALKDRVPLARLLNAVLADSGYDASLTFEHLGDRKLANLWKLIDLARTFDRSGHFGLADFIQQLSEMVRTQPREEQAATQAETADLVKLMTIHQAKGLEFPVVFLPDISWQGGGTHQAVALWDEHLGCVVKPPTDERPAFFSEGVWKLWQARETIDEAAEDLRTLYVACTRAMDCLVLSAALAEKFTSSNTWTQALEGRFRIETGACLDPTIAAEETPRVRVVDGELPPAETRTKREPPPALEDKDYRVGIEEVSPRWSGKQVIPVAWLEQTLGQGPLFSTAAAPTDFREDVDEDGVPPARDGVGSRERIVRAVLSRWDFHQADGWRSALQAVPGAQAEGLEGALSRFAASPIFRGIAVASACHRDVEFLLPFPAEEFPGDERPLLHGSMDALWQDGEGSWHLLALGGLEEKTAARPLQDWKRPRRRSAALPRHLVTWVWAVKAQLNAWPGSLTLYSWADGESQRWTGSALRPPEAWAEIRAALVTWSGQLPP